MKFGAPRRGRHSADNAEQVLVEARAAIGDLRDVLKAFRANLDDLEGRARPSVEEEV